MNDTTTPAIDQLNATGNACNEASRLLKARGIDAIDTEKNNLTRHQLLIEAIASGEALEYIALRVEEIKGHSLATEVFGSTGFDTKPNPRNALRLMPVTNLMEKSYRPDWLVDGFIERGNLGLIFGQAASAKSLMVQDMCFCVAAGIDFHGKPVQQGNVIYIAGEGFSGLAKRFKALTKHYGCNADKLFLSEQPVALMDADSAASIKNAVEAIGGASLIVIDTLHRNMGVGDENSSKDFAQFLTNLDTYLKPTGASVLIIHHNGHDAKERSRGSSAIRAAMDVEYQVVKNGDFVTVTNTKMKDFDPHQALAFKLKQVELDDRDHNDNAITSVVLESTHYTAPQKTKYLNARQQDVLHELYNAIDKFGTEPTPAIKAQFADCPIRIPQKVVHSEKWRELAYKVIEVDSDSKDIAQAKRKSFSRHADVLKSAKKINFYDGYYWAI